jgi:hypothetical protein
MAHIIISKYDYSNVESRSHENDQNNTNSIVARHILQYDYIGTLVVYVQVTDPLFWCSEHNCKL